MNGGMFELRDLTKEEIKRLSDKELDALIRFVEKEKSKRVKEAKKEKEQKLESELTQMYGDSESRGGSIIRIKNANRNSSNDISFTICLINNITWSKYMGTDQSQPVYTNVLDVILSFYDGTVFLYVKDCSFFSHCRTDDYKTPPVVFKVDSYEREFANFNTLNEIPFFRTLFNDLKTNYLFFEKLIKTFKL